MITCSSLGKMRFEFAQHEIEEAVRNKRLLSMEVEFSLRCNLRCPYCYVSTSSKACFDNELRADEIRSAIEQAQEGGHGGHSQPRLA